MNKTNPKTCECCGKILKIVFASTKFCTSCSLYVHELKQGIHTLELRLDKFKEKYNKLKEKQKQNETKTSKKM